MKSTKMKNKTGLSRSQVWSCVMSCFPGVNKMHSYHAMMNAFRAGKTLPSVGNWKRQWKIEHPGTRIPRKCPADWTPRGASYAAIIAVKFPQTKQAQKEVE